ncbi:MAG TPA: hypothetical protein VGN16_09400 [Acidobacteriaceae bacterium]
MGQFAGKVEQSLGIIPGTKLWSPFPFAGTNLQDTPPAIDDKEFSYIENFFRIGNGYLRTAWDVGSQLYTAPDGKTILPYFFWYNLGEIDYCAVFFTDGTAVQVTQSDGSIIPISAVPGTFYTPGGNLPICSQSGTQYLLIANNNSSNDYWIWDGTNLFGAGTLSPFVNLLGSGQNYNTPPTVTAFGGTGSGATFTATVAGGSVTGVTVTDPGSGYGVGDVVQLLFSGGDSDTSPELIANLSSGSVAAISISAPGTGYATAPTVNFSGGGGGSGAAATATVSGPVTSITLGVGGSGYTTVPSVALTGGGGTGATATATIATGAVTGFVITNGGTGFTSPPTVTITGGGGTGATGTAVINKMVTSVVVTSQGSGYTTAPSVSFTGGGGSGAAATALLVSSGVASVTVVNGGSGFTSAPLLSFVGGGGAGASGIAVLTDTSVTSISILAGGQGYFHPPTVVISDPTGGVTATATATVADGQIVAITVTNGGSGYGGVPEIVITPDPADTLATGAALQAMLAPTSIATVLVTASGSGYTSAPAVEVQPGANHSAYATVELMPFGVSGSALETFNSRVWLGDPFQGGAIPTGGDFIVSAPGSLTDFATSDGGVSFVNSDRFLRKRYVAIRQSNGYLYFFGDSSVSVVSNITTSGVPASTTFNYLNVDPQIGAGFRDSLQDFGRTIVFSNATGVYGLYGGAATKISGKLDRLFNNAIFPPDGRALRPSSAVATIFNVKHHFFLFTITDPELGSLRNVMVAWNEREWTIVSQTPSLTYIGTQEVESKLYAWGTDGSKLYQLFEQPSASLTKRLTTKYYGTESLLILKDFLNLYLQAQDFSTGNSGITMNVEMVASGIAVQPTEPGARFDNDSVADTVFNSNTFAHMLYQQPVFNAPMPYWPVWGTGTGGLSFNTLGVRFTTQSPDFGLANLVIAYQDNTAYQ